MVEWITSNSTITTISVDATGSNVRIIVYIYGVFYSQEDTNYRECQLYSVSIRRHNSTRVDERRTQHFWNRSPVEGTITRN